MRAPSEAANRGRAAGAQSAVAVVPPLLHRRPHGQKLVFKFGTGVTSHQVQLQCNGIRQFERAILTRDQQRGRFTAGAS